MEIFRIFFQTGLGCRMDVWKQDHVRNFLYKNSLQSYKSFVKEIIFKKKQINKCAFIKIKAFIQ